MDEDGLEIDSVKIYATTTSAPSGSINYGKHDCYVRLYDKNGNRKRADDHPTAATIDITRKDGKLGSLRFGNPRGRFWPGYWPRIPDTYTEQSANLWSTVAPYVTTITDDDVNNHYRNFCVKCTPATGEFVSARFPATGTDMHDLEDFDIAYRPDFYFSAMASTTCVSVLIRFADSAGAYVDFLAKTGEQLAVITETWTDYSIPRTMTPYGSSGTIDWTALSYVKFQGSASDTNVTLYIDKLYFQTGYAQGDYVQIFLGPDGGEQRVLFGEVRTADTEAVGEVRFDVLDFLAVGRDKHIQDVLYQDYKDQEYTALEIETIDNTVSVTNVTQYPSGAPNANMVTAQNTIWYWSDGQPRLGKAFKWPHTGTTTTTIPTGWKDTFAAKDISDCKQVLFLSRCSVPSEALTFYIEDSGGNRQTWNVTTNAAPDTWTWHRLSMEAGTTTTTSPDYTDITGIIMDGLDYANTYYFELFSSEPYMSISTSVNKPITLLEYCNPTGCRSNDDQYSHKIQTGHRMAERFMPTQSKIYSVVAPVKAYNGPADPVLCSIYSNCQSTSVQPSSRPIATASLAAAGVSTTFWSRFTFSSPVEITPGQYHWLVFSAYCGTTSYYKIGASVDKYLNYGVNTAAYDAGAGWILKVTSTTTVGDIMFHIHDTVDYVNLTEDRDFVVDEANGRIHFLGGLAEPYTHLLPAADLLFNEHKWSGFTGEFNTAATTVWNQLLTDRYSYVHAVDTSGVSTTGVLPFLSCDDKALTLVQQICDIFGYRAYSDYYSTTAATIYIATEADGTADPKFTIYDGADYPGTNTLTGDGNSRGYKSGTARTSLDGAANTIILQGEVSDYVYCDYSSEATYGERHAGYSIAENITDWSKRDGYGKGLLARVTPPLVEKTVKLKGTLDADVDDVVRLYSYRLGALGDDYIVDRVSHQLTLSAGWETTLYLSSARKRYEEVAAVARMRENRVASTFRPLYNSVVKNYSIRLHDTASSVATSELWAKLGTGGTTASTDLGTAATDAQFTKASWVSNETGYRRGVFFFGAGNGTGKVNEIAVYSDPAGKTQVAYKTLYPLSVKKFKQSTLTVTMDMDE